MVDAFREVAASIEQVVDSGERVAHIDANDLIEALLAVADSLDPPVRNNASPPLWLLDATRALLEAGENQMVTAVEWDQLRHAVEAARVEG